MNAVLFGTSPYLCIERLIIQSRCFTQAKDHVVLARFSKRGVFPALLEEDCV